MLLQLFCNPKVTVFYRNKTIHMKMHSYLFLSAHLYILSSLKIIYLLQELLKCVTILINICSSPCPYIYLFQWLKSCSSPLGETQIFNRQWQNDITSKGLHFSTGKIHWTFCCFFSLPLSRGFRWAIWSEVCDVTQVHGVRCTGWGGTSLHAV